MFWLTAIMIQNDRKKDVFITLMSIVQRQVGEHFMYLGKQWQVCEIHAAE